MACRIPNADAFEIIAKGVARIITLSEAEIADAVRLYYRATHNIAEGAGAAPLAGAMKEKDDLRDKTAGAILCGQNIDTDWASLVLSGGIPKP